MAGSVRTYSTIIVDDNDLDRLSVQVQLKKYPFLQLTGSYRSAEEALAGQERQKADVLLLDIDMPGIDGHELRRRLNKDQVCIFITSYPDYAVESFALNALDFLVKPIDKERFEVAMHRLEDYLELRHKAGLFEGSLGADTIFIKDGHDQVKIRLHDIVYLEALKDYTRIVTPKKKYCVLSILGNLLEEAAFSTFIRIHRSYAVQRHYIQRITSQQITVDDIVLPVGRSYKHAIEGLLNDH